MTSFAVSVERALAVVGSTSRRHALAFGLMLVLVMPKVPLGGRAALMRAVGRRRTPDPLERYDNEQKRKHPTMHV